MTAYLDAVETDAGRLARLQAKVQAPKVDPEAAGETVPLKRGRPRKPDVLAVLADKLAKKG
jgi:hypothetical protein